MADTDKKLWGAADAYDRYMGRWSSKVAPMFLSWLQERDQRSWLDAGCGTGVLTRAVVERCNPRRVLGLDTTAAFLEAATKSTNDPRVTFQQADMQSMPLPDSNFDVVVSGLVLNFLTDKPKALSEMVRTVAPGGTVALYVWDYAGHMQIMRHFFDAAAALDPASREFDDGLRAPICRPAPLCNLLESGGLSEVMVEAIDVPAAFGSFEDYWFPFLGGTGSAPKYCASLDQEARERLREAVHSRLPIGPDGEILLALRAFAARGTK